MEGYEYKRILLKLSGETLKGDLDHGYDADAIDNIVRRIGAVLDNGVEVALVVGAGNIWRGVMGTSWGLDRVSADYMGMLATVMNGICLKEAFNSDGFSAVLQASVPMGNFAEAYNREKAVKDLESGRVVIFAGGTGSPFFTTDTTASLRALETNCEAVLKATRVDGIYTADPLKDPTAKRYTTLTYDEAINNQLAIMDSTAFSMCRDNNMPIIVFNFFEEASLEKVLNGDTGIATVVRD